MALEDFRVRFGKAMMELIGTALLVLTIQLSVGLGSLMTPIAIGVVFITMVYAGMPISGAHYNPAVSLAVFIRGSMALNEMFLYWIFQIVGAILGALLGGIIGGTFTAISVGPGYHFIQAFLAEIVFTGLLCFVVLAVATNSKVDKNQYYGAAIGLAIMAGTMAAGPISGAALNPAVALGLGITKHFWRMVYVAWVVLANVLGSLAGAACFYIVAPDQLEHFAEEAHNLVDQARAALPGGQQQESS